jgi:hypothetical protein
MAGDAESCIAPGRGCLVQAAGTVPVELRRSPGGTSIEVVGGWINSSRKETTTGRGAHGDVPEIGEFLKPDEYEKLGEMIEALMLMPTRLRGGSSRALPGSAGSANGFVGGFATPPTGALRSDLI